MKRLGGLALAAVSGLLSCRDAPPDARLGWQPARLVLAGRHAPAPDGATAALMEVWGARLRLAAATPQAPFALDAARATPALPREAFGLSLALRVPPPCTPAALGAVAEGLWSALAAPRGAGLHALDGRAAARVADALRASPEVADVSTAAVHGGLVAVALAPAAHLRGILAVATRAAVPALAVLVPAADRGPSLSGGLAHPDVTLAIVTPAPAFGPERVASVEVAPPRDGLVRITVLARPEAAGDLAGLTGAHLGRHLPILTADGRLLAAPLLATRVSDGRLELRLPEGGPLAPHALAAALGAGALPAGAPSLTRLEAACGEEGPLEPLPAPPAQRSATP